MSLSVETIWEVRTGGSDNNGGGFVEGASGTDYSQQNAAQATLTAASVVNATTTKIDVDAGDHTVVAADVGNIVNITGGTATAGRYQITAVDTGASPKTWTLDRSAGTAGQTVVASMGGAIASVGELGSDWVGGQRAWIKDDAVNHSIGTFTANVSDGYFNTTGGASGSWIRGYGTTRGDGTKPTIIAAVALTSVAMFYTTGGGQVLLEDMILDCNSQATTAAVRSANDSVPEMNNVDIINCIYVPYFNSVTNPKEGLVNDCSFVSTGSDVLAFGTGNIVVRCLFQGYKAGTFVNVNGSTYDQCVFDDFDTIRPGNDLIFKGCVFNNFSTHMHDMVSNNNLMFVDCIFYDGGGWGVRNFSGTSQRIRFDRCAYGLLTSGFINAGSGHIFPASERNTIVLTADPFTNRATGDFTLNDTAGGGALLKGIEFAFPGGNFSSYPDIGAAQHQDTGGGGSVIVIEDD